MSKSLALLQHVHLYMFVLLYWYITMHGQQNIKNVYLGSFLLNPEDI
jgi:hypothetical protein